jgi:hypothetical protein
MSAIVFGLARRLRMPALTERHSSTLVLGVFAFVNGLIAIGATMHHATSPNAIGRRC